MNAQPQEKMGMTAEEYLALESTSQIKHEYFNGEIFAMTGGSLNHNRINFNISRELGNQLKKSACDVFTSDMRVKVDAIGKYTYPDIVISCGEIDLENIKGIETLLNPIVIIEVLSNSTELYDRGKKFQHYRLLPSLREYILVSQNFCQVERFVRGESGIWQILNPYTDMKQTVKIEAIDCELPMSEIYYRVEFVTDSETNQPIDPTV